MTILRDPQTQALVKLRWVTWFDLMFVAWIALFASAMTTNRMDLVACSFLGLCLNLHVVALRVFHSVIFLVTELKLLPEKAARLTLQSQNMPAPKETKLPLRLQLPHLWQVGWIRPIDFIWFAGALWSWYNCVAQILYNEPFMTPWMLSALMFHCIYFVTIAFRIAHFVLLGRAEIEILPAEAMRLIVLFQKRGSPQS